MGGPSVDAVNGLDCHVNYVKLSGIWCKVIMCGLDVLENDLRETYLPKYVCT